MSNILVSACIITYNQEKYIEKCIKAALEQNLNVSYEIIGFIHINKENETLLMEKELNSD